MLKSPKRALLGKRLKDKEGKLQKKYSWFSVEKVFQTAEKIGSGLINKNLLNERSDWKDFNLKFVGIYSKNNTRYLTIDIACGIYGITSIPIYDTLGEEATNFAFKQTKMISCFVTSDHVKSLCELKSEKNLFTSLKNLIILDKENLDEELTKKYKD